MSQAEAVRLIQASGSDNVDTFYTRGESRDGRPFSGAFGSAFGTLPPADQVAWGELEVGDEQGRELIIALGPGGAVAGIHLRSPQSSEGWRYALWRWVSR
jgi:hypothetical protein